MRTQTIFIHSFLQINDYSPSDLVADVITQLLARRHGRKNFFIFNTDAVRKSIKKSRATMTLLMASIAVISLLVGGIGVMNIMLVSVTDRTRKIGVRTAVGARQRYILQQFLIEAVIVCLVGGMLGVTLAFVVSFVFSRVFTEFPMIFSTSSTIAAVIVSTVIGLIFGFIPARNAAHLDPIEAWRESSAINSSRTSNDVLNSRHNNLGAGPQVINADIANFISLTARILVAETPSHSA